MGSKLLKILADPWTTRRKAPAVLYCAIAAGAFPTPAHAIPSPELVVGSVSSLMQLIALLAATLFGGTATVAGRPGRAGTRSVGRSALARIVTATLLLCVGAATGAGFIWLEQTRREADRLQAPLQRPVQTSGRPTPNASLKDLSFAQQMRHPTGISTEDADELVAAPARGERSDALILDVREPAETSMRILPGAHTVRLSDLPETKFDLVGKQVITVCRDGNRSREACEALAAKGANCRFIVGGLEKWMVERRQTTGSPPRSLADLNSIPDYRHRETLLDTRHVHRLVRQEQAVFVDVRFPDEFKTGHLPGAINIPIRWLSAEALKSEIEDLPRRPIMLPCSDRRSCFFAEVLGFELMRAGHDYRGRYTVPSEYFVLQPRPPYIERWIEEGQRGPWSRAVDALAALIAVLASHSSFPAVIVLMALLSRLLILPFSLKAERDHAMSKKLAGEMAELKARLRHDPHRLGRTMRAFYRRNGLTPGRNLLALLFLPIMALAVASVHQAGASTPELRWLWLESLAAPDPVYLLPMLFGALIALYLHITIAHKKSHRIIVWGLMLPAMAAVAAMTSAAAGIYLVASAAFLLAQRAAVGAGLSGIRKIVAGLRIRILRLRVPGAVIWLDDLERLFTSGNKAHRLGLLKAEGIRVPDGLVLTDVFLARFSKAKPGWRRRRLNRLWRALGSAPLAVRSSAAGEDASQSSFAGVFESKLNVGRDTLDGAIDEVAASFSAARASSYQSHAGAGNIILQRMVQASYAGVVFTRDPAAAGAALVELGPGTAEMLVGGATAPAAYRFGRHSKMRLQEAEPPIDLAELIAIGQRAERLFGAPQDLEWAFRDGQFFIVQSRDMTAKFATSPQDETIQAVWSELLDRAAATAVTPDEIVFEQDELAELLPRPTPLSLSLMKCFWEPCGSIDRASRRLGLVYEVEEGAPDYLLTVMGRLYSNSRQKQVRRLKAGAVALRRAARSADAIADEFHSSFLPEFSRGMSLLEAVDFERMGLAELTGAVASIRDDFVGATHDTVDVINLAAAVFIDEARRLLIAEGIDPAPYLSAAQPSAATRELERAASLPHEKQCSALRSAFGHRAPLDYEISAPRYGEDAAALESLRALANTTKSSAGAGLQSPFAIGKRDADAAVDRARRFQTLKEDAKHASLRQLAVFRRAVLALDAKLELEGNVFWLNVQELLAHQEHGVVALQSLARTRRLEWERLTTVPPLPTHVSLKDLEVAASHSHGEATKHVAGVAGNRVSGSCVCEGRARVVARNDAERGAPIFDFTPGDIIVASMFHPAWLPHLRACGGVVTELGGWLSHMALLARELDVAMIVGTRGMSDIRDGVRLRLHSDGRVEIVETTEVAAIAAAH